MLHHYVIINSNLEKDQLPFFVDYPFIPIGAVFPLVKLYIKFYEVAYTADGQPDCNVHFTLDIE